MKIKLWVDDERYPGPEWLWDKDSESAIETLSLYYIDEMSLDHDLGGEDTTRAVVLWLCEHPEYWPGIVHVHSANPIGREWLEGMINRYGPGVT